jgi:hypothetical protein
VAPLEVAPVRGRVAREAFIGLPYRLHRSDAAWVPPLRRDVRALLSLSNPFFEHADAEYFLARRNGHVVGRMAAIHNLPDLNVALKRNPWTREQISALARTSS